MDDLEKVLIKPTVLVNAPSSSMWEEFERERGLKLPSDYKAFLTRYGSGSIEEFLWILNPHDPREQINFFRMGEELMEGYNYLKERYPEQFFYSTFPNKHGLLP